MKRYRKNVGSERKSAKSDGNRRYHRAIANEAGTLDAWIMEYPTRGRSRHLKHDPITTGRRDTDRDGGSNQSITNEWREAKMSTPGDQGLVNTSERMKRINSQGVKVINKRRHDRNETKLPVQDGYEDNYKNKQPRRQWDKA